MSRRKKPAPIGGRAPLQPDRSAPPVLYVRLGPEEEAALARLAPDGGRSEVVRRLIREAAAAL